jgi:hypothetical protein
MRQSFGEAISYHLDASVPVDSIRADCFYQMEYRAILIDRLLKNSDCRLLKTISEGRRAENRRAEAY